MGDLHFLPYLRRGLVRHVASADPGSGAIGPAGADMSVVVAGQPIATTVNLLAPHHVASIAPSEIVRRYPTPGVVEVEANYFPLIEFAAPDLPWRFSPAAPGADGRLRPWIGLVVVTTSETGGDAITYFVGGDGTGRLSVPASQLAQLPPIDDVWAWAHVQSQVETADVPDAATSDPASLRSRLICPRRLAPGVTYRAALVNLFTAGDDQQSLPAWSADNTDTVTLIVYDTWTFTTSADDVDFELLCERLVPNSDGGRLGVRRVDVSDPGIPVDWPRRRMTIDLVGALADVTALPDGPPAGTSAFADAVVPMLNETLARGSDPAMPADPATYDPLVHDPVVGIPFYGSWPAAVAEVPPSGWPRELNVQVDARIAAGLGAKSVRRRQESLMAAAWDQLGQVREVSDELNRGRLSAEVGRTWQARVAAVDAGDRLAVAAPLLTYVRVKGEPARRVMTSGPTHAVPAAPAAIIDRSWLRRATRVRAKSAATAFVQATRPNATSRDLRAFTYQAIAAPVGLYGVEEQLLGSSDSGATTPVFTSQQLDWASTHQLTTTVGGARLDQYVRDLRDHVAIGTPARPGQPGGHGRPGHPGRVRAVVGGGGHAVTAFDVAAAAATMDPLLITRAALVARVPALDELLPPGELPASLALAPQFPDALFLDLARNDADVIVPGLDGFTNNRVRLLAVNGKFVAAYLAGANHEMAREFLWREYPVDLAATFFQRFFDYLDADAVDITAMADWKARSTLAANAVNAAATTVILIRADLVQRYPDLNIFIAPQGRNGNPLYAKGVQPTFEGRLASDVVVVGFPLAPEVVLGQAGEPEHFIVLEERVTAPRFGLDITRPGPLTTWDELAWTDIDADATHVSSGSLGDLGTPVFDGVAWGRNAAHMAAAVHQRPFRRVYPASHLIG